MNKEAEIVEKVIANRRSTFPRSYSGEKIPDEVLERILKAAENAPSHKMTKPARFKLFRDEEKMKLGEELAKAYKENTPPEEFMDRKYQKFTTKMKQSDAVLTIVVHFSGKIPEWEEIASTAMSVENMYLLANALGVGCYWSSTSLKDYLREYLNLADNEVILGFFYMGMKK